jgi:two-component system nitrogen regulation response regulator NtrX
MAHICLIDDDKNLLDALERILHFDGHEVEKVSNPLALPDLLRQRDFALCIVDVRMPGLDGLQALEVVIRQSPGTPVIMISGQSSIDTAMAAVKSGAYDFLEKPISADRLLLTVKNAIDRKKLIDHSARLERQAEIGHKLIAESTVMQHILAQIREVAPLNTKVLLQGESGTGKDMLAESLHKLSDKKGSFVAVNCASIPRDLLESELFGHRKGAFTGATADRTGLFMSANNGTLFLDEIAEMSADLQAKLLRVLQNNRVSPIGDNREYQVDVRIIAATNQDLPTLVEAGRFRRDLYYRLNVISIVIPPLRERRADIMPMIYHFLAHFAAHYEKAIPQLKPRTEYLLEQYAWPGNVRELQHLVEKLVIFADGPVEPAQVLDFIRNPMPELLPEEGTGQGESLAVATQRFEKHYIEMTLHEHQWQMQATARALGIDRSSLFRKLRKLGISKG